MVTFRDICDRYGITVKQGRKIAKSKKGFTVQLDISDTPEYLKRKDMIELLNAYAKL